MCHRTRGKDHRPGYNRRNTDKNTLAHAEITAINKASKVIGDWRLEECTLYVTLEPCQMCAGAIVQARIPEVVMGCMNPKAGCAGSILNILEMPQFNHQVKVTRGILEVECSQMLKTSATDFYAALNETAPDLILLDIMLPDEDGLSIVKKLRTRQDTVLVPVIMVTAKTTEIDKVKGLDLGADDYITKPFGVMELISRVKAMLRRSQKTQDKDKILKIGNIVLDREKHSVMVGKEPVELTYKEYELLKLLMTNAGIVTTRELILDRVWGIDFEGESRTLDMHIKTLRQKLKEEGSLIKTVRNVGYIMNGEKA